ncbi:hypothetical protein DPMN_066720 [Dreissena polymorpha]|uniref:Uncharacterized protein n=1 Tax=Dreissena polymorpha TaxID=45954 RepID=A0A9D3YWU6_DREPO|nr:hypothetical protein DPMN_066720 [Dreissena polymorpha]
MIFLSTYKITSDDHRLQYNSYRLCRKSKWRQDVCNQLNQYSDSHTVHKLHSNLQNHWTGLGIGCLSGLHVTDSGQVLVCGGERNTVI